MKGYKPNPKALGAMNGVGLMKGVFFGFGFGFGSPLVCPYQVREE